MSPRRSLGALVLLAIAAAGCSAGQNTETDKERGTPYIAQASAGSIAVRGIRVVVADTTPTDPTSPTAYLLATIVNRSRTNATDALTGATVGGASVTPTGGSTESIALAPQQVVQIGDPDLGFTGTALGVAPASPLVPGTTTAVTFTFQDAGTVSVDVPVQTSSEVGSTASAAPIAATG